MGQEWNKVLADRAAGLVPGFLGANQDVSSDTGFATADAGGWPRIGADGQLIAAASRSSYGVALGRGGCNVPIGLHTKTNAQGVSNGVDTSTCYTTFHPLTDPKAGSILPTYDNWYGTPDTSPGNAITISAAVVTDSGIVLPFSFGGAHSITIQPGGIAIPDAPIGFGKQVQVNDPQGFPLPVKGVWVRTYVSVSAGQRWPIGIDPRLTAGEGNNGGTGADLTLTGSGAVSGGAFSYAYGPCQILGRAPSAMKPIIGIVGDSIVEGSNDFCLTRGFVERACEQLGYPMVKLAKGGESASTFAVPSAHQWRGVFLDGCSRIICNYGTNDLVNGNRTAAQLKADLTTIWSYLSLFAPVCQLTIPPRTTSTDQWTTLANQTASGSGGTTSPAVLADVNDYIRAQAGTNGILTDCIDFSDAVSSSHNSGVWAANASTANKTYTDDGTHPSSSCIVNILTPLLKAYMTGWSA